jgi:hypothetical protein
MQCLRELVDPWERCLSRCILGDAPNGSSGALKGSGGKETGAQIADYIELRKLLKTEMDVRQAILGILNYAVRVALLKSKESNQPSGLW